MRCRSRIRLFCVSEFSAMSNEGHSCRAAAAHFRVSVSFVVNLVKAFRMRGSLSRPSPVAGAAMPSSNPIGLRSVYIYDRLLGKAARVVPVNRRAPARSASFGLGQPEPLENRAS